MIEALNMKFFIKNLILAAVLISPSVSAFERGINIHFKHYPRDSEFYIQLAKKYGFTSIRDDYPWQLLQKNGKDFLLSGNVNKVDYLFSQKHQNISSMLILAYGNQKLTNFDYPRTEEDIDNFVKYVSFTAARCKGTVKYYEIWNEWLYGTGIPFKSTPPDFQVYLKLVKKSSEAIRKQDPNAIIVAGSINPFKEKEREWMDNLIANGMLDYVDGISLHPYSYGNPDMSMRIPENNIKAIDKYEDHLKGMLGKSIPLYITEVGYTSYNGPNGVSDSQVYQYMQQYMDEAEKRDFIKGVWWYDLIDDGSNVKNREHRFGVLNQKLIVK
jgi:beta-glucosidase/6-phospho-beta-glucosidase/beta-galactosidase